MGNASAFITSNTHYTYVRLQGNIMNKTQPKLLTVTHKQPVTPHMLRLTLSGDWLQEFAGNDYAGAYIKLELNAQGHAHISAETVNQDPLLRTYSIRRLDTQANEIDVDFVLHGNQLENGIASYWAQNVEIGTNISVRGPGTIKAVDTHADWYCFAADMTALPALSTVLEQLRQDAVGFAVIQITSAEDKQPLVKPDGLELVWVESNVTGAEDSALINAVKAQPWREGRVSAWAACEFSAMRQMRQFLRNEKDVDKDALYLSSYWKQGRTEDQHKIDKRQDLESQQ